jgi:hypothetical protein
MANKIKYYSTADQEIAIDYQSEYKLSQIFGNKTGSKCICIDSDG